MDNGDDGDGEYIVGNNDDSCDANHKDSDDDDDDGHDYPSKCVNDDDDVHDNYSDSYGI